MEQGSTSLSTGDGDGNGKYTLLSKHKVFLSHSGAQKGFVEQLCVDLERCDRHPFFDKRRDCLPIGKDFPSRIFDAIERCEVGVVVLSEEFFCSKWPMLELVAMANVKKRRPSFSIMPIFLGVTFSQCRDVDNHKRWLSLWHTWAEWDSKIVVKDWENALQLFGPTNGLKYNFDLGEVKFREEIVEAVCKLVPPETRFEDSHVQGRSRLCKVIHEAIENSRVSLLYGMRIVGLYGFGGIGKTTICKSMCNDLSQDYCDKVCHIELGSQSEEEVFKRLLRRLTNKNLDHLQAIGVDKLRDHLMRDMMNVKVFLAIDNVSSATRNQALSLLRANYGLGSVVLVTARSLIELTALHIDARECNEMPELELEEARSLFLHHVACVPPLYLGNKEDLDLVSLCLQRCHFKKGDGSSCHYHPLALRVLGDQLGGVGYVPARWRLFLDEIDFLNPFREPQHPVFSILRVSFDALHHDDQLLFMDMALFAPYRGEHFSFKWSLFDWLGMVHGICVPSVMERLENMKRKSMLENLGNGFRRIGMHDLWREFARLETKVGKIEERRWIFEWDEHNALGEASLTWGGGLVSLRRMFFLKTGLKKLKDVDFSCFPNMTILKLCIDHPSTHHLDLKGLINLKSLELEASKFWISLKGWKISVAGLGSLRNLVFLRWLNMSSDSACIEEIGCLTNLQVLDISYCGRAPNMCKLISLQVASFRHNESLKTIVGLSSNHTNLQLLDLSWCPTLQSCWGVGELVALRELRLQGCSKLKEVPNLQKLKRLQKLDVSYSKLLRALPGLDDLVSLLGLRACKCVSLKELPDMRNLQNLKILDLSHCNLIRALPGLDELVGLQSLETIGCTSLTQLSNMHKLTNLQTLKLDLDVPLQSFVGWSSLNLLQSLEVGIDELFDGPALCKFTKLKHLRISGWQIRGISSLTKLVSLESLIVINCTGVHTLPNLKKLSRLRELEIYSCEFANLSGLCILTSLEELEIKYCNKLEVLPNFQELACLKKVSVVGCTLLRDLPGILGLQNLESLVARDNPRLGESLGLDLHRLTSLQNLDLSNSGFVDLHSLATCTKLRELCCSGCPIQELPDLANFPELSHLYLCDCVNLTNLTCSIPLSSDFGFLAINGCKRLQGLLDLTNSRNIYYLNVANSGVVLSAQHIQEMKAQWPSMTLVTNEASSQVQSHRSSHGIWHRIVGMLTPFHCRCIGTSVIASHPS